VPVFIVIIATGDILQYLTYKAFSFPCPLTKAYLYSDSFVTLASYKTSFGLAKPEGWGSWRGKAWAKDFGLAESGTGSSFVVFHQFIQLVAPAFNFGS
jgi:hypothetical protein